MSTLFSNLADHGRQFFSSLRPGEVNPEPEKEEEGPPLSTQVKLSAKETEAIRKRIDHDYELALDDHQVRIQKFADQEYQWRAKVGIPGGEGGKSNFRVPIVLALCLAKHAREIDAVCGSDPAIKARPRGPSDTKASDRVSIAMTWQFYENMQALKPLAVWMLRRVKHGRSFAFIPWSKRCYNKFSKGATERVVYQEGPEIHPLGNDEIMLPADVEGCGSVQTASWVMRRYKTTPTEMLFLDNEPGMPQEGDGDWYQGIRENFGRIVKLGREGIRRDSNKDATKIEADYAEGVQRDMSSSVREYIEVEEWYIRWRMEVAQDEDEENRAAQTFTVSEQEETLDTAMREEKVMPEGTFDDQGVIREMLETDLVVRYIRDLSLIVGVQRLDELYPDTPTKRPIMEMALLADGQYWCMGLIELAEEIEKEMTVLANRTIEAAEFSIGPPIFAEPSVGENVANRKYEAFDLIWVQNAAGVKQLQVSPNLEPFAQLWLMFQSVYEQLTGITNLTMGRGMDQPNAPRTLGGQRLVMGAGDVRLALDMRMLGEDLKRTLNWIWDLWRMFGSDEEVYRVAEGDVAGFDHSELDNGWAKLGPKERDGDYDFTLEFSDDMQIREGKKQAWLALLPALTALPMVAQDASIQHRIGVAVLNAFGEDPGILGPEPPPGFLPRTPDYQWTQLLQGETVHPHPMDDPNLHIADLEQRVSKMMLAPKADQDQDAMFRAIDLIEEYKQQLIAQQQAQIVMQGLQQMVGAAQNGLGGGQDPLQGLLGAGGGQPAPKGIRGRGFIRNG